MGKDNTTVIYAPMSGDVVSLDEVPDPVFSGRVLGDGVAIIPADGKIYSPVNGVVETIAKANHAYGIKTDDGIDLLIHCRLESMSLEGEAFKVHVVEGARVKAGDLIAEVDLDFIKSQDVNPITPVVLCGGAENKTVTPKYGMTKAPNSFIMNVDDETSAGRENNSGKSDMPKPAANRGAHASSEEKQGSNMGKIIAAVAVLAVVGGAAFFLLK